MNRYQPKDWEASSSARGRRLERYGDLGNKLFCKRREAALCQLLRLMEGKVD